MLGALVQVGGQRVVFAEQVLDGCATHALTFGDIEEKHGFFFGVVQHHPAFEMGFADGHCGIHDQFRPVVINALDAVGQLAIEHGAEDPFAVEEQLGPAWKVVLIGARSVAQLGQYGQFKMMQVAPANCCFDRAVVGFYQ